MSPADREIGTVGKDVDVALDAALDLLAALVGEPRGERDEFVTGLVTTVVAHLRLAQNTIATATREPDDDEADGQAVPS